MSFEIKSLPLLHSGKVADVYLAGGFLLVVRTDRGSGLNARLLNPIPDKGIVLTQLSRWWMNGPLQSVVLNHLTNISPSNFITKEERALVRGSAEVVRKLSPIPVEAVVRRHLTGTGYKAYQQTGEVCGIKLPPGLRDGDRLDQPIFTPTEKSDSDPPITFEQMVERLGYRLANQIRNMSLKIFEVGEQILDPIGIILADAKFEFGLDFLRNPFLIDEVLTPDSSRFWLKKEFDTERKIVSYDKQKIRDEMKRLKESGEWDGKSPLTLSDELVKEVSADYKKIYHLITGFEINLTN